MRSILLHSFVLVLVVQVTQADAGNVIVDPCCPRVVRCCRPVLIYRRPLVRSVLVETRLALHYHLNYRYYRGSLFGPRVIFSSPIIYGAVVPGVPIRPTEPTPAKPPYLDKPAPAAESNLVPVQPSNVAPEPKLEQPNPEPEAADPAPQDDPDVLEIPQSVLPSEPTTTTLMLQVPAGALVTINGFRTTSTGTQRTFVSRNLDPQTTYVYDIVIQWQTGTITRLQRRSVEVIPGATAAVHYRQTPIHRTVAEIAAH